jgi:hypothetical protein
MTSGSSALATTTVAGVAPSRISDVDPDADLRLGNRDQRPNLARVVHAELDNRHIGAVAQLDE